MKHYTHLFFDLDHTLWDLDENSRLTIDFLFYKYELVKFGIPDSATFFNKYLPINQYYWKKYDMGKKTKEEVRFLRFWDTLLKFDVTNKSLAESLGQDYVIYGPQQQHLLPGAIEVLEYLKVKYPMYLITNGFKEAQYVKIKASGLKPYFKGMFVSEEVGFHKPDKRLFEHALRKAGAEAGHSLMIGDNLKTDIAGAASVGMDQVYFMPGNKKPGIHKATHRIKHLLELKKFL